MRPVLWTDEAVAALSSVQPQVAEEIFEAIELLTLFPHMGTPLQDEWQGFRKLTVRRHRILYQLAAAAEQIIVSQLRFPGMR